MIIYFKSDVKMHFPDKSASLTLSNGNVIVDYKDENGEIVHNIYGNVSHIIGKFIDIRVINDENVSAKIGVFPFKLIVFLNNGEILLVSNHGALEFLNGDKIVIINT